MKEIKSSYSTNKNSFNAGKEIGKELADIDPKFVFLFASSKHNFQELVGGILSEMNTVISGASTAGETHSGKLLEGSAVAIGFNSPHIAFGSGIGTNISKNPLEAGSVSVTNALASLRKENLTKIFARYHASIMHDPTKAILNCPNFAAVTLIDGLSGAEEKVLRGVTQHSRTPLPVVGGSAGDDLKLQETIQVCNNEVYKNSIVTTMVVTNASLGFAVQHGWTPRQDSVLVTKSKGRRVYELNNKPAVDVYAKLLGVEPDVLLKERQIAFGTGLQHPLAVVTMSGEYWLKHPKEVLEDGSIDFFSDVLQGTALVTTDGDPDTLIEAGVNTVQQAIDAVGKDNVKAVLLFNCVARKAFLGNRAEEEVKRISELTDAPIVGMYTYGEQAFSSTTPVAHRNQTLVAMVIGGDKK